MATRPAAGLPKLSRRSRILITIGVLVLILLVTGSRLLSTYIDWLWFGEVGYRSVFSTQLVTSLLLFLIVGLFVGGALAVSLMIAFRTRPVFVPVAGADDPLSRYRAAITRRLRLFGIGIPVVVGLIAGLSARGDWQLVQLFFHGTSFGTTDPVFGKDIGFYAFTLPFVLLLKNWLFVAVTIAFFGALIAQYLFGGIRLAGRGGQMSAPARMQLAILIGFFVLLKAFAYFTDRYELLYSTRNSFDGASYTDLNALLPAKLILLCIAVFCAVAFFTGAFLRNLQLPAIALILLVLSSVLIGAAWPAVMQQFSVRANQNQKEAVSIQRNIQATQQAYGLTDSTVSYSPYDPANANVTPSLASSTGAAAGTVANIRLLDPNVLSPTFTQKERLNNLYGFPSKLNIDRYTINGTTHDYVVAAREINPDALTQSQGSWINRHMVYTHGDGFVAARADQTDASGYPNFLSADSTDNGVGTDINGDSIQVSQPRVYYGLLDDDYAIVGGQQGQAPREYDTPTTQSTYNGSGGVSLSNWFTRAAFALHYGERNFLFNDSIGSNSKILYQRNPIDRVQAVAPWLTVDGDPYPTVVNDSDGKNRIAWVVDGYTTLQNYPYAQQESLSQLTNDSLTGVRKQADTQISYIRNSVKAVVDAYSGKVTLYSVDDTDPVLKAWENVFPGTVKPSSQIPAGLSAHFRYPEDMFNIQRSLLADYHVTDPQNFFSQKGFWNVPNDPADEVDAGVNSAASSGSSSDGGAASQPPYYVLAQAPGQTQPTFQLTSALTGLSTQNMAAWVSVSSDPGSYGKFTVLTLPTGTQTLGPVQMQSQFESTPKVTENRTLFNNPNVKASYGNLLTLPVGGGILFVEPIYIQRADSTGFPQLVYVLTGFSGGTTGNIPVGFQPTLTAALNDVFSQTSANGGGTTSGQSPGSPSTAPSTPSTTTPTTAPANSNPGMSKAVDDINTALQNLLNAEHSGNFQQIGDAQQALQNAISEYKSAQASASTTTAQPPSPTPNR
ncbi:MAG TPA: UPF0182 family protein [Pseudonocardiaceae bacterium]|nr:UPF0182 family protein [Pseudonocardiaceae bacterium]